MKCDEIRTKFLDYFSSLDHVIFPSDSLVPKDDPTVLFTSAGMNQFKPYFLGIKKDIKRAASCQKCLRTDDLAKVGKTPYHHSFFEMLGNFSFGDYFKKEAISWAWEFLTQVLRIPEERLLVSVYEDDDNAYEIWKKIIGLKEEKIFRFGEDKNFWPANAIKNGPDGPCGPCSEIFYDLGPEHGCGRKDCNPGCDCGRFVETWNLVFTQFERKGEGNLIPLPAKNIDTGMGLERLASIMQNVLTNFEIDIFQPIVSQVKSYVKKSDYHISSLYAIADHIRAITFAIGDGVFPTNEERGYVVRKLIRKAYWHGYKLGIRNIFLYRIVPTVVDVMKHPYPELLSRRENIAQIVKAEEEKFSDVLAIGIERLEENLAELERKGFTVLKGENAFKFYDTYGFPLELIIETAKGFNISVDVEGFHQALERQRKMSQEKSKLSTEIFDKGYDILSNLPATKFVGYDILEGKSHVLGIFNHKLDAEIEGLKENEEGYLVLNETPFYAEAGGQVGDRGKALNENFEAEVIDTIKKDEIYLHCIKVLKGYLRKGDELNLIVDKERRFAISKNHTATHLLQYALRKVLGEHVEQSGSLVTAERLRFDFTHFHPLSSQELRRVEELVNELIVKNDLVKIRYMSLKEAQAIGALAFFGEKYKEPVRVVEIGNYSKELCGGTHLATTGLIGIFKIVSETSIASGIRRIEAITSCQVYKLLQSQEELLQEIREILKVEGRNPLAALHKMLDDLRQKEILLRKFKNERLKQLAQDLLKKAIIIEDFKFIKCILDEEPEYMRKLIDEIKALAQESVFVVLAKHDKEKLNLYLGIHDKRQRPEIDARKFIEAVSSIIEGGGGGRKDFAQAGGKAVAKLEKALDKIEELLKASLKK